jgi:diguanylate cyclase (GGDEF)-like protein
MVETLKVDSPAYLRHEYRTPVNHIVGYSELLIDEATDRRLEPFVPVFRRIQECGHKVLEAIGDAFGEHQGHEKGWEEEAFKSDIAVTARDISSTLCSLKEELDRGHRETLADLAAISGAIERLSALTGYSSRHGNDERENQGPRCGNNQSSIADSPGNLYHVPLQSRGGRILIAEDDDVNRNLLRRRLTCDGHEVTEARNGLEVLELLQKSQYDLVLLDMLMPVMDGFEALARMKADAVLRDLPVIVISALEEIGSVVRCIEMGAEDYLTKPFNRVLLRARIEASLEKKWMRDRERAKTEELERALNLLEKAQEELAVLASQDPLTTLPNRRSVEAQMDSRVKRGNPLTAIYVDLNGFKKINDTYGHEAGDDLLKQVGVRLRAAFRSTDTVGRWGGDEFVVLVDATGIDVQHRLSKLSESLSEEFTVDVGGVRHSVKIGASVGVATWRDNDTKAALLHRADFAMYEEKLRRAG